MAYYRLYFFRLETGRIREAREFEAPNDFGAIQHSAKWRSGELMELWSGNRKVTSWTAIDGAPTHWDRLPERYRPTRASEG